MMKMALSHAPWTDDEVKNLNDFQGTPYWHPFTYGEGDAKVDLIATREGWVEKLGGPVVQTWAHAWMVDGSWRAMVTTFLPEP